VLDYDLAPRAVRDIVAARDWYDQRGKDLGNRFLDAVLRAVREAREHPNRFPKVEAGVRAVGCVDFPYRVYYEPVPERIIIRAVYHSARNPRNWKDESRT
jgi:plasmid stabilization system protein ParE